MTDAGYKAAVEYMRGTVRRWGRGRTILVGVLGALMILAVGVISAAALVGLPTSPTSNSTPTSNNNPGASQGTPTVNNVAAGTLEGATALAVTTPTEMNFACALKSNGLMRYVTNLNQCKKSEEKVTIKPGPVRTCVQPDG